MTQLEKLKADLTAACCRLHEHSVKIDELRRQGAPFEEIESAISARRSLAQHVEHMGTVQLQPLVAQAAAERRKLLPAEIARLENRLAELRGQARKFLEENLTEIFAAAMERPEISDSHIFGNHLNAWPSLSPKSR